MAVIVEDGTGKTNSNSYASDEELTDYASSRNIALNGDTTSLLLRACDWLETLEYIGNKKTAEQALQWPRIPYSNLAYVSWVGPYYIQVDGFIIENNEIPVRLKKAQLEAALSMDAGYDILANQDQPVAEEQIGPIKVKYLDGSDGTISYTAASSIIAPLLSNNPATLRVYRV